MIEDSAAFHLGAAAGDRWASLDRDQLDSHGRSTEDWLLIGVLQLEVRREGMSMRQYGEDEDGRHPCPL